MRYWPRRWTNRKEKESFSLHWALPTTSSDFKYSVCFKVNWDSIARRVRFQQTLNCNGQQRPLEHKTISNYSTLKSKVRMLFFFYLSLYNCFLLVTFFHYHGFLLSLIVLCCVLYQGKPTIQTGARSAYYMIKFSVFEFLFTAKKRKMQLYVKGNGFRMASLYSFLIIFRKISILYYSFWN